MLYVRLLKYIYTVNAAIVQTNKQSSHISCILFTCLPEQKIYEQKLKLILGLCELNNAIQNMLYKNALSL